MSDGTVLRGDLVVPADADGNAIDKKFPVIVTITAYNKSVQQYAGGLAGGDSSYLVQRGYLQLTVDARGTGRSEGTWEARSRGRTGGKGGGSPGTTGWAPATKKKK